MGIAKESKPHLDDSLTTESRQGLGADQFQKRLDRYATAKRIGIRNQRYISTELKQSNQIRKVNLKLRECANYLVFHNYFTKGEYRLAYASLCKQSLLCPLCAIRRGAKLVLKYLEAYKKIMAENARLTPYMVTLTVKDGADLSERFSHLQSSIRKYHKQRHLKHYTSEVKKAHSATWSYEVKRGKGSGLWHPHVHAVWLCEKTPCQDKLAQEWKLMTGDSYIVDIRPIDLQDPITGFLEVFKYAVKFNEQEPADTWHCYQKLSGRRLIGSFGGFRGIKTPDDLMDELEDELPFIEMILNYKDGSYILSNKANI